MVQNYQRMLATRFIPMLNDPQALLAPPAFQERWKAMYPVHQYSQAVAAEVIHMMASNNHRDFTAHMGQASIMTMASGGSPPQYKYYFYGQVRSGRGLGGPRGYKLTKLRV